MRTIDEMRADAEAVLAPIRADGVHTLSVKHDIARDVLDLLDDREQLRAERREQAELNGRLDTIVEAAEKMREAAQQAWIHLDDLREAWRTGAVATNDGKGPNRANHNVEVEVALRNAIAAYDTARSGG